MKIGVVHGRFQPIHLGHILDYILLAKKQCDYLYIGITNSDPMLTNESSINPDRSKPENNPLSYYERLIIIKDTLPYCGISLSEFDIIPFPINYPELIHYYVPTNAKHYITIFDDWGRKKAVDLKNAGFEVEVLYEKPLNKKLISSTLIRNAIFDATNWEQYVHKTTAETMKRLNLDEKIKNNSLISNSL